MGAYWSIGRHYPPGDGPDKSGGDMHETQIDIGGHHAAISVFGKTEQEARARAEAAVRGGNAPSQPRDNGGPAYPTPRYERGEMYSLGMTLRDAAVIKFIAAQIAWEGMEGSNVEQNVAMAHEYADAFLRARLK